MRGIRWPLQPADNADLRMQCGLVKPATATDILAGDGQSVVDSTHTVSTVTATSEQALPPGYRWQLLG